MQSFLRRFTSRSNQAQAVRIAPEKRARRDSRRAIRRNIGKAIVLTLQTAAFAITAWILLVLWMSLN